MRVLPPSPTWRNTLTASLEMAHSRCLIACRGRSSITLMVFGRQEGLDDYGPMERVSLGDIDCRYTTPPSGLLLP
jgi:hypothetical protein